MSTEEEIILNAINDIRKKAKKRPDKDRIISHVTKKNLLNEDDTATVLDGLANDGSIYLETYEDGTTAYFISKSHHDTQPCSLTRSVQTESVQHVEEVNLLEQMQDDLIEFKSFVHGEILSLKARVSNRSISDANKSPDKSLDYERLLIRSLEDRILSLERQLAMKQNIIDQLIESLVKVKAPHVDKASPLRVMNDQHKASHKEEQSQPIEPLTIPGVEKNVSKAKEGRSKKNKRRPTVNNAADEPERRTEPTPVSAVCQSVNVNDETGTMSSQSPETCNATPNEIGNASPNGTRKRVIVVGDSMLNGVNEKGLSRNHFVKVHAHGGATSEDLVDHIKPVARRAPNLVIIHVGSNDLTKDVKTIDELQKVVDHIKKESPSTDITISSVITRTDKAKLQSKVPHLNGLLKSFCSRNVIDYIDNNNIDASCLGIKKLHLSKRGKGYFANNLKRYIDEN